MSQLTCLTTGSDRAFPAYPRVDRYFPAAAIEEARQRITRCIVRGDGPAMVSGPTGTGKTLMLQLLATQLADRFTVAFLTSTGNCTRRGLLQSILFELRQPYRDGEASELRLALIAKLLDCEFSPNGLLLLVDEAHLLSTKLLEELRVLGNLSCGGEPRVRLVLSGSLQLEESFTSPELEIFSQRLSARCYLSPFNYQELIQYMRAQVAAVGVNPDELFSSEAISAVYQATDGIPRLVNQLCDRALLIADERQSRQIDKSIVELAWADLQQLPTPWIVTSESARTSSEVVEFGSLDDTNAFVDEATELDDEGPFEEGPGDARPKTESSEGEGFGSMSENLAAKQKAIDPFDESFQEEEVVLDRFASLESAFQPSTPRVQNRRETSWSQMLRDADQGASAAPRSALGSGASVAHRIDVLPESESVESVEDYFDEPLFPQFSRLVSSKSPGEQSNSGTFEAPKESDVLYIEEHEPTPAIVNRQVQRREFRQLFASLRGD